MTLGGKGREVDWEGGNTIRDTGVSDVRSEAIIEIRNFF